MRTASKIVYGARGEVDCAKQGSVLVEELEVVGYPTLDTDVCVQWVDFFSDAIVFHDSLQY